MRLNGDSKKEATLTDDLFCLIRDVVCSYLVRTIFLLITVPFTVILTK